MQIQSLGGEDPLEEGMATHSGIFAWRIPWAEEPGRLQAMGLQRVTYHECQPESPLNKQLMREKIGGGVEKGSLHWRGGCAPTRYTLHRALPSPPKVPTHRSLAPAWVDW